MTIRTEVLIVCWRRLQQARRSCKVLDMSGEDGPRNSAAMSSNTALVMCESHKSFDACVSPASLGRRAHSRGALFSVDNTLMTGLLVRPLDLGADFVVTSCTKSWATDTMAGVVAVRDPELAKRVYFYQNAEGTGLAPFDC